VLQWEILKTGDGNGVVGASPAPLGLTTRRGVGREGAAAGVGRERGWPRPHPPVPLVRTQGEVSHDQTSVGLAVTCSLAADADGSAGKRSYCLQPSCGDPVPALAQARQSRSGVWGAIL
jgi:hypothetical protein